MFVIAVHCAASALGGDSSCRVIGEESNSAVHRIVAVCSGSGERRELAARAHELALKTRASAISDVVVGVDETELNRSVLHRVNRVDDGDGFAEVLARLRREGTGMRSLFAHSPLLRIFRVANDVVETFVQRPGSDEPAVLREQILGAGAVDPRIWKGHASAGKLEWVEVAASPAFGSRELRAFVIAPSATSCETCRGFLEQIKAKIDSSTLTGVDVRVRSNAWFAGGGFPLVFRFTLQGQLFDSRKHPRAPSVEEYYRTSSEAWCNWQRGTAKVPCRFFESRPQ